ncbi:MAG: PH domain-containing protein, partial [Dehalococcoidia bacterium]
MPAVLLQREGLTIGRPQRALGTLVGATSSLAGLSLAAALLATAIGWPISFTQFLAYTAAGALALLSLVFAFWAYSCFSLRYTLDADGLTIRWGRLTHFVSTDRVQEVLHGRGEHQPTVRGLNWWGHHVGRGHAHGLGQVIYFSTHRAPEELVYVRTAEATYGLSPQEPLRFIAEVKRLQEAVAPIQAEDQAGARPAVQ